MPKEICFGRRGLSESDADLLFDILENKRPDLKAKGCKTRKIKDPIGGHETYQVTSECDTDE